MSYYPLVILAETIPSDVKTAIMDIVTNTNADPWTYRAIAISSLSMLAGIVAAVFALLTWWSQKQTERNTHRLEPEVQKNLLIEMCRHLYRNMVISKTLGEKLEQSKFSAYPSEEHLVKMKVNLEDIHDELFYKQEKEFFDISKLYVLLRNYNAELDIICNHFRDAKLDDNTKRRDIKTLLFKCGELTSSILKYIELVWPGEGVEAVKKQIKGEWRGNAKEKYSIKEYKTRETVFTETLFPGEEADVFLAHFNEDVRVEMGENTEGGEKIHMIKFAKDTIKQ